MRQSQLFTKTRKDAPADEVAKNAQLLIRAGFIHKEMAGVYAFLPLGLRVLENIKQIVREEMNQTGAFEFIMTTLQRQELWEKTDRWDDEKVDIWFKTALKNGTGVGLAWSHEEPITEMMKSHIASYKDMPAYVYQFQTKLRNETRAKSGIMRGREFVMKDLYSYSRTEEEHQAYYNSIIEAYHRVFDRLGIGDKTFFTLADGGAFTDFSHEFQTVTEAGEDTIYVSKEKNMAVNEEVMRDDVLKQHGLKRDELEKVKAAEVGNIFNFGGTKSEELGLYFQDENDESKPVILGSYGIGISRLVGVITELMSDEKGLVWSENIAPAKVHLVRIGDGADVVSKTDSLYDQLQSAGVSVLYDDTNRRPGQMLADADLIGIPNRVVVGDKSIASGGVELKSRTSDDVEIVEFGKLLARFA